MKAREQLFRHWIAFLLIGSTLTVGALSLVRAVGTIGENFSGFFFGPNLLVSIGQREDWPGPQHGLRSLDQIIAIDGSPISSGAELAERVSKHKPGETLIYRVDRKGEIRDIGVAITQYHLSDFVIVFLAPFLMGLLFVSFGAIMYFSQPWARGSLLYLILCSVIALLSMTLYESYTTFAFFRLVLIYPLIGALSVHLIAKFPEPVEHHYRLRVRMTVFSMYAWAFLLIIFRQVYAHRPAESVVLSKLSSLFILVVLATDVLLLMRTYQRAKNQSTRDKIKVIAIGLFIASALVAAWSLNFLLLSKSFYLDEGILLASVFPLFMGYAILKKNVFELDRVIRLSLSYGVTAAILFGLYLGLLGWLRGSLMYLGGARGIGWLLVALAVFGALLFQSVRRRVNDFVHRRLFRSKYDLGTALADLDRSLTLGLNVSDLCEKVGEKLSQLFDVEGACMICLLRDSFGRPIARSFRWTHPPSLEKWLSLFEAEGFLAEIGQKNAPLDIWRLAGRLEERFPQAMAALHSFHVETLLPCVSANQLFGLVLLGPKLSKDRYDRTDFALLAPLSTRIGMVLQNAHLALEADRQARLAALGQMASVLIHDIKNPLTTIRISAGSIKRRFRDGDRSFELATFIEEEVDRMDRTVQEILSYARPSGVSLQPCLLNGLIRTIVERLAPTFQEVGLELILQISDEDEISGDCAALTRVIENLLINAREATPKGGCVHIRTKLEAKTNGHAHMLMSVEDTGRGMEDSVRDQIFKPFFTTKTSGTGLGLSTVKDIVQEHGGNIDLDTKPGVGTRFVLRFPLMKKRQGV